MFPNHGLRFWQSVGMGSRRDILLFPFFRDSFPHHRLVCDQCLSFLILLFISALLVPSGHKDNVAHEDDENYPTQHDNDNNKDCVGFFVATRLQWNNEVVLAEVVVGVDLEVLGLVALLEVEGHIVRN